MSVSDAILLERWRLHRDAEAFAELGRRHAEMVFAVCRRVLHNASDAEDVAQECFLNLAQTPPTGKETSSLGGWLHTVATRRAIDRLRTDRQRQRREARFASEAAQKEEPDWDDIQGYLDDVIAGLPPKHGDLIVRHFLEGQTHQAIAQALRIPRTTVTSRVTVGIDLVRKGLRRRGITVTASALASLLTIESAEAIPATLTAALGKIALATSQTASLTSSLTTLGGIVLSIKKTVVVVAISVALVAGWLTISGRTRQEDAETETPIVANAKISQEREERADAEESTSIDESAPQGMTRPDEEREEADATAVEAQSVDAAADTDVSPPPPGSISGRVLDEATGDGIPAARVQLVQQSANRRQAENRTSADGSFLFTRTNPGWKYIVRASSEGYATVDSALVSLQDEQATAKVTIRLNAGHALHGKVVDIDGNGLSDMEVTLGQTARHGWDQASGLNAVTGFQGQFSMAHVAPGEYWPSLSPEGTNSITLADGFTMPDRDLRDLVIVTNASADGFVSGSVMGSDERPIVGLGVEVYAGQTVSVARTQADGTYIATGLGNAQTVHMEVKAGRLGYGRENRAVPMNSENVDFVLAKHWSVKGRVIDAATSEPIPQFSITPMGWSSWQHFNSPTGEFTLAGIEIAPVTLDVRAEGYALAKVGPLESPAEGVLEGIAIKLESAIGITGTVVDASSGAPIAGARLKPFDGEIRMDALSYEPWWGPRAVRSDAEGRFEISDIQSGEPLNLVAWKEGYGAAIERDLIADPETQIHIALDAGGTLSGVVLSGAKPVADAMILVFQLDLRSEGVPLPGSRWHASSTPMGEFQMTNLPAGRYMVMCFREMPTSQTADSPDWVERVEMQEGEHHDWEIQLGGRGTIVGRVEGGAPGERIAVSLMSKTWEGGAYLIANCDEQGAFGFSGLIASEYTLRGVQGELEVEQSVAVTSNETVSVALVLPQQE